jgi:hypothetical protein
MGNWELVINLALFYSASFISPSAAKYSLKLLDLKINNLT